LAALAAHSTPFEKIRGPLGIRMEDVRFFDAILVIY